MSETLTFMFSDIEDSSRLWDRHPEPMRASLAQHNALFKAGVAASGGSIVKDRGDGFLVVFGSAADALTAALRVQRDFAEASWDDPVGPLRIRLGVHSGTAEARDGDYFGPDVNRAARLEAAAHGGQILVSEATRALALDRLPSDVDLRDLGIHTLRGLTRPERLYQLVAAGIPIEFPAPRTVSGGRASFPTFATSFVGRSQEMANIADRLLAPETRVLTLLGPGGIGKTRLATETAGHVGSEFPGGAVFADLVPVADADGIPMAIARAIGVHPEGSAPVIDNVVAEISDPTLLVLDNFEHLVGGSTIIADLVSRCSVVTVLVTSRTPLRIQGEIIHQVEPLELESGNGVVPAALGLFVDRAAEHGIDIDLDGPDGGSVRSIVRRLDGLPLAIELVAARVRLLSVAELDRKLGQSLAVVGTGATDLPKRQQTIQSTIAWSVDTLTPPQQRFFNRLSVFPAGATLEQVERVAADGLPGDALDLMSALVDNSLAMATTDLGGGTRFRQLALLREYAAERLGEAGDQEATMSRLVDFYVDGIEHRARQIETNGHLIDEVEIDYPNLAGAMRWSLDAGRTDDMVEVVYALWPVWFNGDRVAEAAAWVTQAAGVMTSPEIDWLLGFFAFQSGDYAVAADRLDAALQAFEAAGDERGTAIARTFVGALADPASGEVMLNEARAHFDADERPLSSFLAKMLISVKALEAGDSERALELRRQLLPEAEAIGYETVIAWAHWNLAIALAAEGNFDEAAHQNALAFQPFAANKYHEGIGSAAEVASVIDAHRAEFARAVLIHFATEAVWERLGVRVWWEIAPLVAEAMTAAHQALGDSEYHRLKDQGSSMSINELVEVVDESLA
jgi:predicted ATPase/class 3 adenylate cyclase